MKDNKIKLLNAIVDNVSMNEAVELITHFIINKIKSRVVAVNVDVLVKMSEDEELTKICNSSDLVLTDGMPLIWLSKIKKTPIKEKVSGSDLVPKLLEVAEKKNFSIFIIGGKVGVADLAKYNIQKNHPSLKVVGTYSPPFGFETDQDELNKINQMISSVKPDLLIACFGCPKQEKWVYDNYQKYDGTVSICAGATVDFLACNIKRCPKWMSDHGLEWVYRMFQDPKRLIKRYLIDDLKIIKVIYRYR